MKDFNISVLGEQWEVRIRHEQDEPRLIGCDGFCDWTSRTIVIDDSRSESNLDVPEAFLKKVLRHEVIHAFFRESGLAESFWPCGMAEAEEIMTDWIAVQLPKLERTVSTAESLLESAMRGE